MAQSLSQRLVEFYDAMFKRFGPQKWWPGRTAFDVIVGAVLTQNTNWRNVEKAIERLYAAGAMEPAVIAQMPPERLGELIRPAGYFNVKTRRLQNLVRWMVEGYGGDVERMRQAAPARMREELLAVSGIGPETADSILLYALGHPEFVVDAYTFRVAARHGLIEPPADYDELKSLFQDHLPADPALFNEYHALLVRVGKDYCRPRARCAGCPLECFPHETAV